MANKSFYTFMKIKAPDPSRESLAAFTRKVNEQFEMSAMKLFGNIESKDLHPNLQKTIKAKVGNETFETYIQQTAQQIELLATKEEVNDLAGDVNAVAGTVSTHTTQISQNASAIALKADQTTVNAQGETISSLSSQLSLVPGQITAEVTNKTVHVSDTPPSGAGLYAGRLWQNTLTDEQLRWKGIVENTARSYPVTESGASVTIEDLSDDHALAVTVKTIAQQAGSGTPSPVNVRPISGMASVDIAINASRIHTLTPPTQLLGLPSAMDTIDTGGNVQHLTDKIVLDGSGDWWSNPAWTANAFRWAGAIPNADPVPGHGTVADILCSHFHANSAASIADGAFGGAGIGNGTEIYIGFADNSIVPFHDVSALKSWLAANPVTIVYKRATPLLETIAPVQINGVDGINTITSDGEAVHVEYTGSGWALVSGDAKRVFASSNFTIDENGATVRHVLLDGITPYEAYTRLYGGGLEIYETSTGEMIGGLTMRDGEVFLFSSALADPRADGEFITRVVAEKIGAWVYQGIKMMHGNDNIVTMLAEVSPDNEYITSFEIKPTPGCSMHLLTSGGVYQPEAFANIFLDNNTLSMECGDNDAGDSTSIDLFPDRIMTVGHIRPSETGVYNLGGTSARYRRAYFTKSPDVSSDARLKQDTTDLDPEFIYKLRPRQYRLKSDPDKLHYGLIAQEVKAALDECGITDADLYGDDDPENLSLCYTELIAPLIATVQHQQRQIDELEQRIAALEANLGDGR